MRIIACLFALVFAAAAPALAQEWQEYRSAEGGFRVEMPGTPLVSRTDVQSPVGPLPYFTALVDNGSAAYFAAYGVYPEAHVAATGPERMLDGARDNVIRNRTLVSEQRFDFGGAPGRHLVIDTHDGKIVVARIAMVETRMIQAIYIGPKGAESGPDAQRFINSLALLPR